MVPVSSQLDPAAMDFPLWTRADDTEDEFRQSPPRRRKTAEAQSLSRNGPDLLQSRPRKFAKRAQRDDLIQRRHAISPSFHAIRRGQSYDQGVASSGESSSESDSKRDSHAGVYPGVIPVPQPKLDGAAVVPTYGLPSASAPTTPPAALPPPSRNSRPKLPKINTDLQPTTTLSLPPDSPTQEPLPPVNNADDERLPLNPANDLEPDSPKSPDFPKGPFPDSPKNLPPVALPFPPDATAPPSSGARKAAAESAATEIPVVTVTESPATSSTALAPQQAETGEPGRDADDHHQMHGNLHSRTENALIAVGSVGATIIVFFVFWLAWKFYKMHRKRGGGGGTGGGVSSMNWRRPNLPASLSMEKPKRLLINVVARVPILKDRVAKRSWSNLEKPYDNSFWETRFADPNERKRTSSRITVHTAITTKSEREGPDSLGLPRQAPGRSAAASFQPTPRSKRQMSVLSDISSLSSGFGDGDIVMPPANSTATTTITTAQLAVPQPVAQRVSVSEASHRRDTMYTEASEDPVPRFRTINSWVRQQSGRIKRAKQREPDAPPVPSMPPEQEFRLMMPDDEEPRRVEEAEQEQFEAKR